MEDYSDRASRNKEILWQKMFNNAHKKGRAEEVVAEVILGIDLGVFSCIYIPSSIPTQTTCSAQKFLP